MTRPSNTPLTTVLGVALAMAGATTLSAQEASESEPTTAAQHLEAIERAIEEGSIEYANFLLDRAFQCEPIDHDQLVRMTQLRAAFAYANGQLGTLERALAGLATLNADLPADLAPPPVQARYAEVRRNAPELELEVELAAEVVDGVRVARLVPRVEGDPGRLVHRVTVRAAVGGEPLRLLEEDAQLTLGDPHEDVTLHFTLEALGVGGALIGARGTDAPVPLLVPALPKDRTFLYVAFATIGAVIVAGAIGFGFAWVLTDGFTRGDPTAINVECCEG